jgi:tetratricopeptide (TPR) repeat protein
MHYLAEFYFQTERYKQAAAIFAELIKKEPSHFNFWYQWIISLHHSKQSDLAQQSFQRAMERFIKAQTRWSIFSSKPPKHEQVLMETRLLAAHRQEKQAIMLYQRLLEQYPESSIIHNDLAWLLVTAHDPHYRNPTLALKHARFALRHAPERYAAYFDTLASALFLSGHIDEAIQAIKAAKNAPGSPNIMPHLYFQLQRFQKRKSAKN